MNLRRLSLPAVFLCLLIVSSNTFAADLTPEEIIAKHLESIGKADARARMNAIAVAGTSSMMGLSGSVISNEGTMRFVSQGKVFIYESHFNTTTLYFGEALGWDGKKTTVGAFGAEGQSKLVDFFRIYPWLLEQGFFGGVLNHGWAANYFKEQKPQLRYDGLKKFNGQPALQLWCNPKKAPSEFYMKLYFDPENYRLLGIQYYRLENPWLEERFLDYTETEGLMLPKKWEVYFMTMTGNTLKWTNQLTVVKPMPQLPQQ